MFTKVARALEFPDFTTVQVLSYFEDYKRNAFAVGAPTQAVLEVTGQQPEDFETIVRRYVSASRLVERSPGAKLRAMGGLMKIMFTPSLDPEYYARLHDIPKLTGGSLAIDSGKWLSTHAAGQSLLAVSPEIYPAV